MTKTIVLLGFSTTGKSRILNDLKTKRLVNVDFIDTDTEIAKNHDGHIYNVFIDLFDSSDPIDRKKSLTYIENSEKRIIDNLCKYSTQNRLIAPGPFLPFRQNFQKFINFSHPEFIFLKTDAENVYNGLIKRHERQIKEGLDKYPHFGCWDLDVTKGYQNGRYILLPKQIAINNIRLLLDSAQQFYKSLAVDNEFDSLELNKYSVSFNKEKYDAFIQMIENKLKSKI